MKMIGLFLKKYEKFKRNLDKFKRWLTFTFLVLIMPSNRLKIFLGISVSLLLFKGTTDDTVEIDMNKFFSLINNNYSSGAFEFPNFTLDIMWRDSFLNSVQDCKEGRYRIQDMIVSKELLLSNLDNYVDNTLTTLPFLLKMRLGISEKANYAEIKRELSDIIQHNHQTQQI